MQTSPLAPKTPPEISEVAGVRLATAQSGITYQRRDDLMLMCFDKGAAVAGGVHAFKHGGGTYRMVSPNP